MFGGSSSDPFVFGENLRPDNPYNNRGFSITTSKVLSSPINKSVRNLILFTTGDSNMAGVAPSGTVLVNSTVIDNFNIYDGVIYKAADPLLGCNFSGLGIGGISGKVADKIISGGRFDRVIIVPIAIGGTTTNIWAAGGVLYTKLSTAVDKLARMGITPSTNVTFTLINQIGANEPGQTPTAYASNVRSMVIKAQSLGFSGKVFIPIYSMLLGVTDAGVQAGEALLVDNITYFTAGNIDSLSNIYRQADVTHFTDAGQVQVASIIYANMQNTGSF